MNINVFYGILIPFLGTSVGAACVIFMKKNLNAHVQRALTGFASGVMVAASVWSLLLPSIEQSGKLGKFSFVPAVAGFWAGVLFLLLLDHVIPHIHQYSDSAEGPKSKFQKTTMMVLAVTLHNIPEGMAVGVVCAGYLIGNGSRCCVRRTFIRKQRNYTGGSIFIVHRNCNSEFSGGCDHFHAPSL